MEWACNACTFFNKGGYLVCEICSAQRPNPLAAAIGGATASAADSTTAAPKGKRKRGTYLDQMTVIMTRSGGPHVVKPMLEVHHRSMAKVPTLLARVL